MPQFTDKQLKHWRMFEDLKTGGLFNMAHPNVAQILGIDKKEHLFILKNYAALKAAYEEKEDNHYDDMYKRIYSWEN